MGAMSSAFAPVVPSASEPLLHSIVQKFLEENAQINLSAFRTEETCWTGNVLDSVAALDFIHGLSSSIPQAFPHPPAPSPGEGRGELRILDLGTGGGFPLLALAACLPEAAFFGLDSVRKKVDAVTRVVEATGLANVQLLCGRAEEIGRKGPHRAKYDVVTSRAVGPLAVLLELSAPLLKVSGYALCWKSLKIEEELAQSERAQKELKLTLKERVEYTLPGDWGKRQILCFQKQAPTSGTYPRAVGVPGKFPLTSA